MSEMSGSFSSALERPEAEQLVEHVGDEVFALEQAERRGLRLGLDHRDDQVADLRLRFPAAYPRQPLEVQAIQQLLVNPAP